MSSINTLYHTVKYLRYKQINYRVFYLVRGKVKKIFGIRYAYNMNSNSSDIYLKPSITTDGLYDQVNHFTFLNISHAFGIESIDWNYPKYGKLWTYNMTYFDFLNQSTISKNEGTRLINDFIEQITNIKDGMEAFPISLRAVNWIKFLVKYKIKNQKIDNSLYAQYYILLNNLEYHLLGNHLLENAFSLLFGAYYFKDEKLYTKSQELLISELNEQILDDGAHFELSPMYHQMMLFRVLDCINLVSNNKWKNDDLLKFLIKKASVMLGWLDVMTFRNGNIPLFNDSANKIAPTTKELQKYASILDVDIDKISLSSSGYRKYTSEIYELVVDVGNIGPDYILGHAHADTFNFELYVNEIPIIVDTGTSTYNIGNRRAIERSTLAHNTVCINKLNQSDIWGGFRVGKRAKIINLIEKDTFISATHDGYSSIKAYHTREFIYEHDMIQIIDRIDSEFKYNCMAYIHFHPNIQFEKKDFSVFLDNLSMEFIGCSNLIIEEYLYSNEFNKTSKSKCLAIYFDTKLITKIAINNRNMI